MIEELFYDHHIIQTVVKTECKLVLGSLNSLTILYIFGKDLEK